MEHAYEYTLREYCREVRRRWCQKMYDELDAFSSDLYNWLYDHFENRRPDWRERYQQFVDEQAAAGRLMSPESQQELRAFLESHAEPELEVVTDSSTMKATGTILPRKDGSIRIRAGVMAEIRMGY